MKLFLSFLGLAVAVATVGAPARAQDDAGKIYFDLAHGEGDPPRGLEPIVKKLNLKLIPSKKDQPITADRLKGFRLLYLRAPSAAFGDDEKKAILGFLRAGGSLFLVLDEERRQSLKKTGVNDLIEPFGLRLTPDTEYVHNCGAIAKKGDIHAADREIPYSGGRAVEGGSAFAWQLDKAGKPAQPCAAHKTLEGGGNIVVMGEGMASLLLGTKEGVRLSGTPRSPAQTTYWGKDSAVFNEEVLAWLIARTANDPKKAKARTENKLVGTWRLVKAKYGGKEVKIPEGTT